MKHVYAALLLNESGKEMNESNLTAVLDAAGVSVQESRTRALVAALEGVDVNTVRDGVDIGSTETGRSEEG